MRVKKALIPAAGLGTRFLPATKSMPKEMLPIIDTPVIQYVVEEAIDSGIKDIIIITGRGKRAIEDYFDYSPELEMYLTKKMILNSLNWSGMFLHLWISIISARKNQMGLEMQFSEQKNILGMSLLLCF